MINLGKCSECKHAQVEGIEMACTKTHQVLYSNTVFYGKFEPIKQLKIKAYIVSDKWGENSRIEFAETSGKAKSNALYKDEFDNYNYVELRTERIKDFDKYAETKEIPIAELLKHGWYFYCAQCMKEYPLNDESVKDGLAFIVDTETANEYHTKGKILCKSCYEMAQA